MATSKKRKTTAKASGNAAMGVTLTADERDARYSQSYLRGVPRFAFEKAQPTHNSEWARTMGHLRHWERANAGLMRDCGDDWRMATRAEGVTYEDAPDENSTVMALHYRMHLLMHPDVERLDGSWLKFQRNYYGLSLDSLAQHLGITDISVGRWENQTRTPNTQRIAQLRLLFIELWRTKMIEHVRGLLIREAWLLDDLGLDASDDELEAWQTKMLEEDPDCVFELLHDARFGMPLPPSVSLDETLLAAWHSAPDPGFWGNYHARMLEQEAS